MPNDRYTKIVLTVIAVALAVNALEKLIQPTGRKTKRKRCGSPGSTQTCYFVFQFRVWEALFPCTMFRSFCPQLSS